MNLSPEADRFISEINKLMRALLLFSRSVVSNSFRTPRPVVVSQAPVSMGFPGHEYWSGLPFPSPGHLPDPGIQPASPELAGGVYH